MANKIEVMGILLDNDSMPEVIERTEHYLQEEIFRTIESVSMEMLLAAQKDEQLQEALKSLDLALVGEKEILTVVSSTEKGETDAQKSAEVEENEFFFEFLKIIEQNGKNVFLLGETTEKLTEFETLLTEHFPELLLAGKYAADSCNGDWEAVVNDMNSATPDVILSILSSPLQEHFLWQNKGKINANIWYGVGGLVARMHKSRIFSFFQGKFQMNRLKDGIHKYEALKGGKED